MQKVSGGSGDDETRAMLVADPTPANARTGTAIRAVAAVEGLKGIVVLLAASGLLAYIHEDLNSLANRLVEHAHLNPASKWPHVFLDAVARLDEPRLLLLAIGAAAYAVIRLFEAYGLFKGRAWAEWLSALSGAIYVPFEIVEVARTPSLLTWTLLAVNIAVVAIMARALWQRRAHPRRPVPRPTPY
jgi:uncharacterized membrane protein (DUF2068 family)